MKEINTIFWDWNGTLLNDTELCRNIVNKLLRERNKEDLSIDRYKEIFTFPVRNYYVEAGFDFSREDFSKPADAFIEEYNRSIPFAKLHQHTEETLTFFNQKGIRQIIISAMKHDALKKSVKSKNIDHYFEKISGINNHYAEGKMGNAKNIIHSFELNPKECCLIGDTIHDHEVAQSIGCHCILIANGHQSKKRLEKTERIVLNSIDQIQNYF